jgi:hypothetical protein
LIITLGYVTTCNELTFFNAEQMMIMMSMGRDYVYELWPLVGPSLIPHMIYEHREAWWNDIDRGKLLIRPPELSGNGTNKVI